MQIDLFKKYINIEKYLFVLLIYDYIILKDIYFKQNCLSPDNFNFFSLIKKVRFSYAVTFIINKLPLLHIDYSSHTCKRVESITNVSFYNNKYKMANERL